MDVPSNRFNQYINNYLRRSLQKYITSQMLRDLKN